MDGNTILAKALKQQVSEIPLSNEFLLTILVIM